MRRGTETGVRVYSPQLETAVNAKIPPAIIAELTLHGWNAFGIFEIVLTEMKKLNEPICCPHCITGCAACGEKKWINNISWNT